MTTEDLADCLVAKCGKCKRVIFASTSDRVVHHQKELGRLLVKGCTVEHMTAEQVRNSDFGCKCTK